MSLYEAVAQLVRALLLQRRCRWFESTRLHYMLSVAQLVRASRCGREGCGFDSRPTPLEGRSRTSFEDLARALVKSCSDGELVASSLQLDSGFDSHHLIVWSLSRPARVLFAKQLVVSSILTGTSICPHSVAGKHVSLSSWSPGFEPR